MSICDNCIHDEVCGLEDNHEEAITFCADMIPKDILDKMKVEIEENSYLMINPYIEPKPSKYAMNLDDLFQIIDKYKVGNT